MNLFVTIQEANQRSYLEKLQVQAYPVFLRHGEQGTTFTDFITSLGIIHQTPQPKVSANEAVDNAKRIIRLLGD